MALPVGPPPLDTPTLNAQHQHTRTHNYQAYTEYMRWCWLPPNCKWREVVPYMAGKEPDSEQRACRQPSWYPNKLLLYENSSSAAERCCI